MQAIENTRIHLFILSPPFCGSTLLWKLISTSRNVSALPDEGQFLPEARPLMRGNSVNPEKHIPWSAVEIIWRRYWDLSKPILLEKSPPNVMRADQIEEHFENAAFIAMMRDPYAFCEGHHRRLGKGVKFAADRWCQFAQMQRRNIQERSRILYFTYEELTEDTGGVAQQVIDFLPELKSIDIDRTFKLKSIGGRRARPISNLNESKIKHLSRREIHSISTILGSHEELVNSFGYEILSADSVQSPTTLHRRVTWAASRSRRWVGRSLRRLAIALGAKRRSVRRKPTNRSQRPHDGP